MTLEPVSIGKSTLICKQLDETKSFFKNKLGLELIEDLDDTVKFNLGNSELILVEQYDGLDITSISQEDKPDLTINTPTEIDNIVAQLGREEIILLGGPENTFISGREYQSVYFRDPDNHLIEIRSNSLIDMNRTDLNPENLSFSHSPGK